MEEFAANSEPAALRGLLESYAGCLALGREYLAATPAETPAEELDLDRLESFLSARAELLAEAARSFEALPKEREGGEEEGRALARQAAAVLEEMTELENGLAAFLDERLRALGATISYLRRVQPVFQRYGRLDGGREEPCLLDRRG